MKETKAKLNLDEILNSEFFKKEILDIEKEKKELKALGWSHKELRSIAKMVIK
tara:strand:- start:318 stop:476 length:159 start_codon:yes stop_codon:yes gene_type:complete